MSSNGEGARGAGHGGTATKKILQSIKEIVGGNFSDDEIYVMLKECNMDPSETIHHLLNQDTFHEVKSKREKKKEGKDNVDSRMRGTNNSSNRGGKGATDRASRIGSAQVSCSGNFSKSIPKKENGPNAISGSFVLGSGVGGTTATKNSTPLSDFVLPLETTGCLTSTNDSISSQYSAGVQSSWGGTPGQRTLADIVKMGRLPGKISRAPAAPTKPNASHNAISATSQHLDAKGSSSIVLSELQPENPVSDDSDVIYEPSVSVGQHTLHDEWPVVDQTTVGTGASLLEVHGSSSVYDDPSTSLNSHVDGVSLHHSSRIDGIHLDGDIQVEDSIRPVTASDKHIQVDNSREESGLDGGPINDMKTYQSQMQNFEHHEGNGVNVDLSSTAASLQWLRLDKEDITIPQVEDNPAVIIPNHLQVTNADCSHLSFGSFGSGISAGFSGSLASKTLKSNLEMPSDATDANPVDDSDARNAEYYNNEQLRPATNENADCMPSTNVESYEAPSSSQPDVIRSDAADPADGPQYQFQPSVPDYSFSNAVQPDAASYASVQGNSQIQNLASFSSVMQAYSSSLPNNLLASTVSARELDLPYASLLATQSMPTKYSTAMSSISGPSVSMPEAVKPGVFSTSQSTQQNLTTTSIPTGPTLPQHLHVHPYSQPTLPLGHFANMIGYPFLPQSYTYMPSAAFQQAYTNNSAYHQPPAAVNTAGLKYTLPQYKTSVAVSSIPQSPAVPSGLGGIPSGLGGFGSSANVPANFALNPSTGSVSSTIGYDDILSSQYKEGSHYVPPQQNESSAMWMHGGGSRTMSALPASTYYSLQGQNLLSGFRQSQQPSHYGAVGYPNFYHSQASAVTQEHQQNTGDGRLTGSQGPVTQTAHQIWQHNY